MSTTTALHDQPAVWVQFWRLTKPRVVSLIVFTAVIGMLLAAPSVPPLLLLGWATLGIALVAGAAAAFNCLWSRRSTP
jgi:protoheme IX farnesyltransferase